MRPAISDNCKYNVPSGDKSERVAFDPILFQGLNMSLTAISDV
jgi:hypothetical protein